MSKAYPEFLDSDASVPLRREPDVEEEEEEEEDDGTNEDDDDDDDDGYSE
jgi:hypothetical protein